MTTATTGVKGKSNKGKTRTKKKGRRATVKAVAIIPKGTKVNAPWDDGEMYPAIVTSVSANGKLTVEFDDGETATLDSKDVKRRKRGRASIREELSQSELSSEIKDLIADLKACDDQDEKKRLRRMLRRRGHTGGLK